MKVVYIVLWYNDNDHAFLTANKSLSKINLSVNKEYGYLSFSIGKLSSLPRIVIMKVVQILAAHISGEQISIHRAYSRFHRDLFSQHRRKVVFGECIAFFPDLESDTMIMGRATPRQPAKQVRSLISVGQTVHWDKRWRVTLKPLKKLNEQDGDKSPPVNKFYVSHMTIGEYWGENKQDNRKVPASILPDNKLWSGLPVVCTKSGHVVVAPHFKIIDHSYGVDCDVTFEPLLPLKQELDALIFLFYVS